VDLWRGAGPEALWAIAAMALSLLAAVITWRLWHANLRVPIFNAQGDAAWTLETVKGIVEHGWYESNHSLGAPFGQLNYDFPANVGEFGKIAIVKVLALGISNPAVIVNLIVIGGFPLVALSAFLVLRLGLGFSRGVAVVCAVLFATSPIHFVLGPVQAWLGFYLGVPLSGYLILAAFGEKPMFRRRAGGGSRWSAWLSGKSVMTIVLCLLVGCLGLDYAEFTCLLVGIGSILQFIVRRRFALLLRAGVVIVAIAAPVLASAIPDLAYRAEHGTNQVVAHRHPFESIAFGLQPIQLVLPQLDDRVAPFGELTSEVDGDLDKGLPGLPFDLGQQISLGLVSAVGLLWLLWVAIGGAFGRIRKEALEAEAGSAALLSILVAMGSGGSLLFAYLVTAQLRVWARIAILIGFFAVVGLGLLLERGCKALEGREHGRWLVGGLLVLVLAAGVFEGTSDRFVPDYQALATTWHEDARFVADVQHTVPADSEILELPYVAYPEARLATGLTSYEPLVPYIHSTDLRWSGGAMEARPEDWLATASTWPMPRLIKGAAAGGFAGIYILRAGYADQGAAVAAEIQKVTGSLPLIEPDGSALFYDLTGYAKRLRAHTPPAKLAALAHETLHPSPAVSG
jgi:phosphoglycerol transferase